MNAHETYEILFQTTYTDLVECFSTADDLPKWNYLIYAIEEVDEQTCIQKCTENPACDYIGTGAGESGDACYLGDFDLGVTAVTDPLNVNDPKFSFNDGNQPINYSFQFH